MPPTNCRLSRQGRDVCRSAKRSSSTGKNDDTENPRGSPRQRDRKKVDRKPPHARDEHTLGKLLAEELVAPKTNTMSLKHYKTRCRTYINTNEKSNVCLNTQSLIRDYSLCEAINSLGHKEDKLLSFTSNVVLHEFDILLEVNVGYFYIKSFFILLRMHVEH